MDDALANGCRRRSPTLIVIWKKRRENKMSNLLSLEQVDFYRRNRYIHLKNIISQDLLELAERFMSSWVNDLLDSWYQEGLLTAATETGKQQGFIARSLLNPASGETCGQWLKKFENIP